MFFKDNRHGTAIGDVVMPLSTLVLLVDPFEKHLMPAKVILHVIPAHATGGALAFDSTATVLVGRGDDCGLRLPGDSDHKTISRHHCQIEIDPPQARMRDLGSYNGTVVNGRKLGAGSEAECMLNDGDKIMLGGTTVRVQILTPIVCSECWSEIPEEQKALADQGDGIYRCGHCAETTEPRDPSATPARPNSVCLGCGLDASYEMGEGWQGVFVCSACRNTPAALVRALLEQARLSDDEASALRGFAFEKELGRGGMGAVFLIRKGDERLAIKVLRPRVAVLGNVRKRFLREITISSSLVHPNVVRLRDVGDALGVAWYRMEYCDGGSVKDLMTKAGGRLPVKEAVPITLQGLAGLEYAHAQGVIHRDVKPSNLFLTGSGDGRRIKVADFGLARALDLSRLTMTNEPMGTFHYMCRQQLIDSKRAGPEVDVWAMAATLYAMLTGKPPRDFENPDRAILDLRMIVLSTNPVPILKRDSTIPLKLAEVIDHALTESPSCAFASAFAFKKALEASV
jgi:eukaryotic-like serine/threonine-protein kinase